MILLNTNAQHIYWLGRYLTRTQYLCSQYPFQCNDAALAYAHGFCLPAFDAQSLNDMVVDIEQPASFAQQFNISKDNIQELRGVLSAKAYAELNQLIKNANESEGFICDVVGDCQEILDAESPDIFLFFNLGKSVEQLDRQLRLNQDTAETLKQMDQIISVLVSMGWKSLADAWKTMQAEPNSMQFYHFSDYIQHLFEVDV